MPAAASGRSASATRERDVQARNFGGRGGPSRASAGGGAVSGLRKRTPSGDPKAAQATGASACAQAEQWPLLQQPRSPQPESGPPCMTAGACAFNSARGAVLGVASAPLFAATGAVTFLGAAACTCPGCAEAPPGASRSNAPKMAAARAARVRLDMALHTPGPAHGPSGSFAGFSPHLSRKRGLYLGRGRRAEIVNAAVHDIENFRNKGALAPHFWPRVLPAKRPECPIAASRPANHGRVRR